MADGYFRMSINTDNDAITAEGHGDRRDGVASILHHLAVALERREVLGGGNLRDDNGNVIGSWEMTPTR